MAEIKGDRGNLAVSQMPQTSGLAAESTQQQQLQQQLPQQEKTYRSTSDWDDEVEEQDFKALTRQEAQALRIKYPSISPWRVVAVQAVTGVAVALLWWIFTGQVSKGWSALSGAAAVVLPNALMAWGMTGLSRGIPGAEVLGFMFWELIKIMTAVAMLAATAVWMPDLSWPALLVALIGCLKVNWLTLFWQGRLNKVKRDGI